MEKDLLDWLLAHYGHEQMRPGLERVKKALLPLLPKFKNTKIITIAGTNGKGETALRLSSLLSSESHFLWTSPHIECITERFRNSHGQIELQELKELISECHKIVQENNYELTFYEFLFFVFCTWAHKCPPKYLILEVGLGGRLDAVNVFDAHLVLLPSISRDHQEYLGNRYDKILKEKLGVLRKDAILLSFLSLNYLNERAMAYAQGIGAKWVNLELETPLPAYEFSLRNQTLAYAAFSYLTHTPVMVLPENFQVKNLKHRGEVFQGRSEWYLFGSHNTDGMRKLIQFLQSGTYNFSRPPFDLVIASFSHRSVRDIVVMLKMLKKSGLGKICVTTFPHQKAMDSDIIKALSMEEGLDFAQDVGSLTKSSSNQRVLVTGSYYFLGYINSLIRV